MERKKRLKRNMIIDRAERIMAKKGYYDMTMDEVAADADVAKGTIYLYFNSKEALCAAVVARIIADMNDAIRQKLEGVQGGRGRLTASVDAVIQWNATHTDKSWVLENVMSLDFKDTEDVNVREYVARMDDQLQIIRENMEIAIDEGAIRPDLDPITTTIFVRMAMWVAMNPFSSHQLLMKANGVDKEALLKNALDFLQYGMRNPAMGRAAGGLVKPRVKAD